MSGGSKSLGQFIDDLCNYYREDIEATRMIESVIRHELPARIQKSRQEAQLREKKHAELGAAISVFSQQFTSQFNLSYSSQSVINMTASAPEEAL